MRTQNLAVVVALTVCSSGCFRAEEELDAQAVELQNAPGDAREQPPAPSGAASTCAGGGSAESDIDVVSAGSRFQGRWLRCGEGAGRIEEASPFAREAAAFEVVGDRWFALERGADGQWVRAAGEHLEGTLSWWTTNQVGVSFQSGEWSDPALVEFLSGGLRLNFYPGAMVLYVPLP